MEGYSSIAPTTCRETPRYHPLERSTVSLHAPVPGAGLIPCPRRRSRPFHFFAARQVVLKPAFIFGTGRCGSTHLQRLISLRTDTWIWGEHDGFLNGFLRSFEQFTTSPPLA